MFITDCTHTKLMRSEKYLVTFTIHDDVCTDEHFMPDIK